MPQTSTALNELTYKILSYIKQENCSVRYVDILNAVQEDPHTIRAVLQSLIRSGELDGEIGASRRVHLTDKGELTLLKLQPPKQQPDDSPEQRRMDNCVNVDAKQKLGNKILIAVIPVAFSKLVDLLLVFLKWLVSLFH